MQKSVYEFISKQTNDPIVERKTCKISGEEFAIYKSDLEFYDKISPVVNGKKHQIPTPTLCPEERQRRRFSFRNERKLYRRKCDFSGKDVISIYYPDKPYKVFHQDIRHSDKRDPMDYKKDIDFDKTFSEQFGEFIKEVPKPALNVLYNENSDYGNHTRNLKNCYMTFNSGFDEDCYYCHDNYYCKNNMESTRVYESEQCYECVDSKKCFKSKYLYGCEECNYANFSINCTGCENIFLCNNLNKKQYYIENKQYTKEEYFQKLKEFGLNSYTSLRNILEKYKKIKENSIYSNTNYGSEDCVGNNIINSKNCILSFNVFKSENTKYSSSIDNDGINSYDVTGVSGANHCFESVSVAGEGHIGSFRAIGEKCYYSQIMENCKNCFGCIGLKNKEYCIFNKQYTKEQYEELISKIIEKMQSDKERGEYLSPSLSCFGYNESPANDYYPISEQEAIQKGYQRMYQESTITIPENSQTINADQLPDDINDSSDEVLQKVIICQETKKPFRIIKPELEFYRKENLALPRIHPDIRHSKRVKQQAKRDINLRNCDKCNIEILSVYPGDFMGKVYCENCYKKEIYG